MCEFIYRDISGARYYTGFSVRQRNSLWDFLGLAKYRLQVLGRRDGFINWQIQDLSIECQFLFFLTILRHNKTFEECHTLFGVSATIISQVFKTWLAFMRAKFKDIENYCTIKLKDLPKLPKAFRNKFLRRTRFSIDCTEFRCESTKNYPEQGNKWSDCKKKTTRKVLIMISPTGHLQCICKVAQGSMSDREIWKQSGFNVLLELVDKVLADHSFNIEDLTLLQGA